MARGQAGAWQHQAGVALRKLDRNPRSDAPSRPRRQARGLTRIEVQPGIAVVGAGRQPGVVVEASDRELDGLKLACEEAAKSGSPSQNGR